MIRKPSEAWGRESPVVTTVRRAALGGAAAARAGQYYARGLFLWSFALLWGFAALAGGLFAGSLPTFVGVGALAAWMAWSGTRMFAKARGS
ncbi:hypothetical protein [uncultured Methylobacterium sp.]|uniref:hypothetical protein n=1 Tax=uncultured Methylobacterium sp. TaxID=157278 RepID=UPI0035CB53B8